jgi:hypothetical protein
MTSYHIDEQKIIDWAIKRLPNINQFDKKIAVVYVNDFVGENEIINHSRFYEIYLPNGELMILDKKDKEYYYYVIFQKSNHNGFLIWDLVGYNKNEIINFNHIPKKPDQ